MRNIIYPSNDPGVWVETAELVKSVTCSALIKTVRSLSTIKVQ